MYYHVLARSEVSHEDCYRVFGYWEHGKARVFLQQPRIERRSVVARILDLNKLAMQKLEASPPARDAVHSLERSLKDAERGVAAAPTCKAERD